MSYSTEKERMLAGEAYISSDPQLRAERTAARRLTRRFNATTEEELALRLEILAELFGRLGPGAEVEPPFRCDYGYNIRAGTGLFLNFGCVFLDCNIIEIGDNVLVGPYVQIYTAYHPTDPRERAATKEFAAPVTIGNNVWLGGGVIVGPGVTIGDNAVIGAGSVVMRDIPANVLAAGNPCRPIRDL